MFSICKRYPYIIAAFFGSCFFITACENDPVVVDSFFVKKTAVEEAFTVESYLSQGAKVKAKLTAPYMKRYMADSPYVEFPKTLHVDFYDDSTRLKAPWMPCMPVILNLNAKFY